ncbi:MAG: hypothetical protein V4510_09255 [bacterium]
MDGDLRLWVNWTMPPKSTTNQIFTVGFGGPRLQGAEWRDCWGMMSELTTGAPPMTAVWVGAGAKQANATGPGPDMGILQGTDGSRISLVVDVTREGWKAAQRMCGPDAFGHIFMLLSTELAAPPTLQGHWNNTALSVSYGDAEGVFLAKRSDAQQGAQVGAASAGYDVQASAMVQLDRSLGIDGKTLVLGFLPFSSVGPQGTGLENATDGHARYVRPDGTVETVAPPGIIELEFSRQFGPWSFQYDWSAPAHPYPSPLLFGTTFTPATNGVQPA